MKTFALSSPNNPKKATIWCELLNEMNENGFRFHVLNGGWEGTFKNNLITMEAGLGLEYEMKYPAIIVWEGEVPEKESVNYIDAIAWINNQIGEIQYDVKKY